MLAAAINGGRGLTLAACQETDGGGRVMSRDDYDDYKGDAFYEAWRRGINPDRLDYDRIHDYYDEGHAPERYAQDLQQRDYERQREQEREEIEQAEREYYEQQEREDE